MISFLLLAAAGALAQAPELDRGSNLMLRSPDMQFAMDLSQSAVGAAHLGQFAATKASAPDIRSFGQQLSGDYKKMQTALGQLVAPMRATLPVEVPASELSAEIKLRNTPPVRLDAAYLKATRKLTIRRIKMVKAEIKKGRDPAVQKFAIETLPVLEGHLERAIILYRATEKKT